MDDLVTQLESHGLPLGPYPPIDPLLKVGRTVQVGIPNAPQYTWLLARFAPTGELVTVEIYNGVEGKGPVNIPPDHPWVILGSAPVVRSALSLFD